MKKYTQEELKELIQLHQEWLNGSTIGRRLDLRGEDLSEVNLRYSYLKGANFIGTNFIKVNFFGADLSYSDLMHAIC